MDKNKIIDDKVLNEVSGGVEYWEDDFDPSYLTEADKLVLETYVQNYIRDGLIYAQGYQKAFNEVYPMINRSHASRNAPLVSEAFFKSRFDEFWKANKGKK